MLMVKALTQNDTNVGLLDHHDTGFIADMPGVVANLQYVCVWCAHVCRVMLL